VHDGSLSLREVFDKYAHGSESLGMNELATMFIDISKKMTNLPAVSDC
jgi:NADH dehydrogenase